MASNSNRSTASIAGLVTPCCPQVKAICIAACVISLVGCATSAEGPNVSTEVAVPARCLEHPKAIAHLPADETRSYSAAHAAYVRAEAAEAKGDMQAAREAYAEAVTADPSHGLARLALAEAHWATDNDLERIQRHLAAAVVLLPRNPRAHLRFADACAQLDLAEIARTHWSCAIELKADLPTAHAELARYALTAGKPAEATRHIRSALGSDAKNYRYHLLLADSLQAEGEARPAAHAAEQAAVLVGRSAALYRKAARLHEDANSTDDADRLNRIADEIDPPPEGRKLRPLRRARRAKKRSKRRRK